jgi:hypothetical protein
MYKFIIQNTDYEKVGGVELPVIPKKGNLIKITTENETLWGEIKYIHFATKKNIFTHIELVCVGV